MLLETMVASKQLFQKNLYASFLLLLLLDFFFRLNSRNDMLQVGGFTLFTRLAFMSPAASCLSCPLRRRLPGIRTKISDRTQKRVGGYVHGGLRRSFIRRVFSFPLSPPLLYVHFLCMYVCTCFLYMCVCVFIRK